ncbi:hypothetical protein RYZ26_19575 [Terasakiella sp. A23]|uniref:hypothetical protein n=1 Tax=Terasakiella sp. FCG-A23 TaxID=3080561 RepID=UPI0029541174|nr:hypothetical protein [Terasakiella sp. A23]MDV7341805.1 hypothetical protein [Terasakiella sp. A23]
MTSINDYVRREKPCHDQYEICVGIDLTAQQLDHLMELLPRMTGVSVSTLLHTKELDGFCRDMFALWDDYVNVEIWTNHPVEVVHLVNLLDVKIDFVK